MRPETLPRASSNFYSRPCGRGDENMGEDIKRGMVISTHAPAGGATTSGMLETSKAKFLLTPLREGRLASPGGRAAGSRISTHAPAGGATNAGISGSTVFQPISTHAPAGGATRKNGCGEDFTDISTHAPAGGATRHRPHRAEAVHHFYSRPCGRGDALDRVLKSDLVLFLLTPLREGRHQAEARPRAGPYFYSRPCGRGDILHC